MCNKIIIIVLFDNESGSYLIHIHFSEKDGVNPIFYLFSLKTFQIVHIAIGLTQELTMYVTQS
ncbi:hypothetical protein COJ27_15840 [Bacillus cereus]|nr:hypothetical protein CN388_04930 [Bacillus cereus]PFL63469.1 hypothetical protein COJ27_15840 [Bacillus cereus]PGW63550.1 hypothetical protein COE18_09960 [Bacillus cereus]